MTGKSREEPTAQAVQVLVSVLDELEARYADTASRISPTEFWHTARALSDRIMAAETVSHEDKIALQRRLTEFTRRVRIEQKETRRRVSRERGDLLDRIAMALEELAHVQSAADVQQVRSDLLSLREQLSMQSAAFSREQRRETWDAWQRASQLAWNKLSEAWETTEKNLGSILDEAEACLKSQNPRGCRDHIRKFHAGIVEGESSQGGLRALRGRANSLWKAADELANEKHRRYLHSVEKRLAVCKRQQHDCIRRQTALSHQILDLERAVQSAATGVGSALMRGQIAERKKVLKALEVEESRLERQIQEAVSALAQA